MSLHQAVGSNTRHKLYAVRGETHAQYVSAIQKKCCKNFDRRKTSLGFPRCCFFRFSSLHAYLLRLRDVMMHPHLIAGDSVPQEIIAFVRYRAKGLSHMARRFLSDLPLRGEEPTFPTLSGNPSHLKWLIGDFQAIPRRAAICYVVRRRSPSIISQIARTFVPQVLVRKGSSWVSFCTNFQSSKNFWQS